MNDPDLPPLKDVPVAVVGAGMAGLTAARKLAKAGAVVTVFEKSRGVGGRLATRRTPSGGVDHGAQYVTAREPGFKAWVARAKAEGVCAAWSPRGKDGDDEWLVGLPGMSGLVASLVDGYQVTTERRVAAITDEGGRFALTFEDGGTAGGFDRVIVAIPAAQAFELLAPFGEPFHKITDVVFGPCWTLLATLDKPFDPGFDVRRTVGDLAWVARSASKPGRGGEILVAQADPRWSAAHLEETAETVTPQLRAMLEAAVGPLPQGAALDVHRWRYALVEKAVGETFLLSADGRIGACGDWLIAPRVESAWASGDGLAEAMVARARAAP